MNCRVRAERELVFHSWALPNGCNGSNFARWAWPRMEQQPNGRLPANGRPTEKSEGPLKNAFMTFTSTTHENPREKRVPAPPDHRHATKGWRKLTAPCAVSRHNSIRTNSFAIDNWLIQDRLGMFRHSWHQLCNILLDRSNHRFRHFYRWLPHQQDQGSVLQSSVAWVRLTSDPKVFWAMPGGCWHGV